MALPLEKFGQVASTANKTFMKGKAFGSLTGGSVIDLDINFDTIYSDAVHLEGYANFIDTFSKITTIENKVGLINAKTEYLSVGSVDNMNVYYQPEQGTDEIVLVNRIINKIRQMWLQGVQGFGPLEDNLSNKIWADKPDDIRKAAYYSECANENIMAIGEANQLAEDWLFRYYAPSGQYGSGVPLGMSFGGGYGGIHGLAILAAALLSDAVETSIINPWSTASSPPLYSGSVYTWHGMTEALKSILAFREKLDAIKAKTDCIPDNLLDRLNSLATDASGANVKAGSAERHAQAAHNLLKDEVLPKVKDCISRVRSSSAWVVNCICRIVKACWAPFKECLKQDGSLDVLADSTTAYDYIYNGPNFGVSGNMQGDNPPGYTFACTSVERPLPYWPLSVTSADATNFRSVIQDLPQAVSAYYWPSAYESRD